jgi:Mor family transcriptional regulator
MVKKRGAQRAEVFVGPLPQSNPDRVDIITEILEVVRQECGVVPELYDKLPEIEAKAREMFGGEKHYAATFRDRQALMAMVRRDYSGRNVSELARRYGVSRRTVYRYLNEDAGA